MAPFNPTPKVEGPREYFDYSKSIQQPNFESEGAVTVKGLAGIADTALKATDEIIKQDIQQQLYQHADKERDDFTGNLLTARDAVYSGQGGKLGILPQTDAEVNNNVPSGVQSGLETISTLQSASGKISSSLYWERLTKAAKEVRAQYPGWRPYIDAQIANITGHNPANAYMTSIIQDLNRASFGQDSFRKKIEAKFFDDDLVGTVGWQEALTRYRTTGNEQEALQFLNKNMAWKADLNRKNAAFTIGQHDRTSVQQATEAAAVVQGNRMMLNALETLTVNIPGLNGSPSEQKRVIDYLDEQRKNGGLKDEDAQQIGVAIMQRKAEALRAFDKMVHDPIAGTNETMASRMGDVSVTRVRKQIGEQFDTQADLVFSKDYGAAIGNAKWIEQYVNDETKGLLNNRDTAEEARKFAVGRKLLGDQAVPVLIGPAYGSTFSQKFGGYFQSQVQDLVTQPKLDIGGPPITFDGVLQDMKTRSIGKQTRLDGSPKSEEEKKQEASLIKEVVKKVELIGDPRIKDDRVKINIAKAAFSSGNLDFLNNFVVENRDPATGKLIPGQHTVWRQWTSPAITKEMYRLGQQDPQLWADYKSWVNHTWGRILFRNDINQLNQIASDPKVRIGWNTVKNEWEEPQLTKYGREGGMLGMPRLIDTRAQIKRVNDSLAALKNVAMADGQDFSVPGYLLKQFLDSGVKFQQFPPNVTGEMLKALILGNQTPPEPKEGPKKSGELGSPRSGQNTPPTASVEALGAPVMQFQAEGNNIPEAFQPQNMPRKRSKAAQEEAEAWRRNPTGTGPILGIEVTDLPPVKK